MDRDTMLNARHAHAIEVFGPDEGPLVEAFVNAEFEDHVGTEVFTYVEGVLIGGCRLHLYGPNLLRIHDLMILPDKRGQGHSGPLITDMLSSARKLLGARGGELRTYPYPVDGDFVSYLEFEGWTRDDSSGSVFGTVNALAHKLYTDYLVEMTFTLPPTLPLYAQDEIDRLTHPQRQIVLGGLRAKLGYQERTGHLSYKFEVCPICKDMGSTAQNDDACRQCYLRLGCTTPFRAGFRDDPYAGVVYFRAMLDYLEKDND